MRGVSCVCICFGICPSYSTNGADVDNRTRLTPLTIFDGGRPGELASTRERARGVLEDDADLRVLGVPSDSVLHAGRLFFFRSRVRSGRRRRDHRNSKDP